MLNRLIKFRFSAGEKVGCISCKSTLRVEVDAISLACQFEKKWADKSFAWIFRSEEMESDPLSSKVIWGFSGSDHLYGNLLSKVQFN